MAEIFRDGKDDLEMLIIKACGIASRQPFDGHLTMFKFTTNWRVSLGTPYDDGEVRNFIGAAVVGKTLSDCLKEFVVRYDGGVPDA